MRKILFAVFIAAALAGCSSTPTTETGAPIDDASRAQRAASGAPDGRHDRRRRHGHDHHGRAIRCAIPTASLSKRSVYFDFDSYVVRDEFKPLVEAHARYLQQNRSARMTIQGNTDERGSREYNIALGQRRVRGGQADDAAAGRDREPQIETVSFGKEKPRNPGHDESAWAENRRDDIRLRRRVTRLEAIAGSLSRAARGLG